MAALSEDWRLEGGEESVAEGEGAGGGGHHEVGCWRVCGGG